MKTTLTFGILLFLSLHLFAQKPLYLIPGWKIKHIGASVGEDKDMIRHLDHYYLLKTASAESQMPRAGQFDRTDVTSMICENPHFRLDVALLPPGMRNTEMRLAVVAIFNRIDEVTYMNGDYYGGGDYQNFRVASNSSEVALEMSWLKHIRLANSLGLYGGIGANAGFVFDGYVDEEYSTFTALRDADGNIAHTQYYDESQYTYEWNYYDQGNGFSQRLFAHAGAGLRFFKRVELGFEYRYGIGYRAMAGAPVVMTNLHSGALTVRWLLK